MSLIKQAAFAIGIAALSAPPLCAGADDAIMIAAPNVIEIFDYSGSGPRISGVPDKEGIFHYNITLNEPIGYSGCVVNYRKGKKLTLRWTPPEGFSKYAAEYYELVVSFVQPTMPGGPLEWRMDAPRGFSDSEIAEYERPGTDARMTFRSFFQSAFVAAHFAHALPENHAKTRRMVNAAADQLKTLNQIFTAVTVQPGLEFEQFVVTHAGSGARAEKSITMLKGLNLAFFRDVFQAENLISSGNVESCRTGIEMLQDLAECRKEIEKSFPDLVSDIANVVDRNTIALTSSSEAYNIDARLKDAQRVCSAIQSASSDGE
ncbi:hypothetical protein [Cereibacter johrii]|uniref:hypothetical protein n=1 Tax=Cereibacter johrii TaxID=445629 RepID=UPI003CF2DD29